MSTGRGLAEAGARPEVHDAAAGPRIEACRWLVQNKDTGKQLSIWLDVATGDDQVRNCGAGSNHCVEAFHALLASKGVAHTWQDQWSGPHEGTYWQGHLPDYMAWYSSQLVGE